MRPAMFGRAMPMMMTAAGTMPPARVFVMGVGVAGLQAIATARRLGAIVSATDVRPATKEQVESLGGKFIAVRTTSSSRRRRRPATPRRCRRSIRRSRPRSSPRHIKKQDIVITTALIPGRPAPVLVTRGDGRDHEAGLGDRRSRRRAGRQLPADQARRGGRPSRRDASSGRPICRARSPVDASSLYARNLFNFVS